LTLSFTPPAGGELRPVARDRARPAEDFVARPLEERVFALFVVAAIS
jgi:hypothetical protein